MPRGVPQIVVTFDIDSDGILSVSAKETSTGKDKKIEIKNDAGRLSTEDIDRMVREAELHKEEDEKFKKVIEAKNNLENYIYSIKNSINDEKLKDKFDESDKQTIQDKTNEISSWLEQNQSGSVEDYELKKKELEGICMPIMTKLYSQQTENGGGMPGEMSGGMPGGMSGDMPTSGNTSSVPEEGPSIEEVD